MDNANFKIEKEEKSTKKKSHKKLIIILLVIVVILGGLTGYYFLFMNKKSTKKKTTPKKTPTPVVVKKLTIYNEDSNERPIAVMIDNNAGTNVHAGLQDSYLNYEIIVEGGLTRIMAIFKDKDDLSLIGPVRSSRHYFLDYALESDCIYAHFGWSTYAQADISALGVNNINGLYDDGPFWRDYNIAAPHNVFTSIAKLYSYAKDTKGYATTSTNWKLLNLTTTDVELNTPTSYTTTTDEKTGKKVKTPVYNPSLITANSIIIPYSNYQTRSYTYDATNKYYLRFMNGEPHLDKTTQAQLHYKNIIIEKVNNITMSDGEHQDLTTVGTGSGYYITNGYALPITWSKASRSAKTIYTYSDGSTVKLNDGNTFIQIEPATYNPTFA
jgi:hypothetical protein